MKKTGQFANLGFRELKHDYVPVRRRTRYRCSLFRVHPVGNRRHRRWKNRRRAPGALVRAAPTARYSRTSRQPSPDSQPRGRIHHETTGPLRICAAALFDFSFLSRASSYRLFSDPCFASGRSAACFAVTEQPRGLAVEESAVPAADNLAAAAEGQPPAVAVAVALAGLAADCSPAEQPGPGASLAGRGRIPGDSAAEPNSGAVPGLACDPAGNSAGPAASWEAAALAAPLAGRRARPVAVPVDDRNCSAAGLAVPPAGNSAGPAARVEAAASAAPLAGRQA
jgi:hypothetical protein